MTGCGTEDGLPSPQVSDAPNNLVASAISQNEIELTWKDNSSDEDGFIIERKTGPQGVFQRIARIGPNITTYNDKGLNNLKPDTTYYYRVAYYRGNEVSDYSNWASTTTLKKVLSLGKEVGDVNPDDGNFSKAQGDMGEERGIDEHSSSDSECSQTEGETEGETEGTPNLCDKGRGEIVLNADSPWMNPVVLSSMIYEDDIVTGLASIHGLTGWQIEEIKRVARYVQSSFLSLDRPAAGSVSGEDKKGEGTRQASEILLTADQRLMEILDMNQYVEFMKWEEGISRENGDIYEKGQIPFVHPPPEGHDHESGEEIYGGTVKESHDVEQRNTDIPKGIH